MPPVAVIVVSCHVVAAAASSTSISRARDFLHEVGAPSTARAYGGYEALVDDEGVDIIYVATPHSHHYQHVRVALEAGKHVLIKKPITVNAEQCQTRFFPLSREVCAFIQAGHLGDVVRVFADFSFWNDVKKEFRGGNAHRMVNMELAGGALLDLGIYSLAWVFIALYHGQSVGEPEVNSAVTKYETGADETATVLLQFPGGGHGVATTSIRVATTPNAGHPSPDAVRIQGTLGDLTVDYAPRPRTYTLTPATSASRGKLADFVYEVVDRFAEIPGGGHGMFWEADECARCVRDGKCESEVMGLGESEVVMRVMDRLRGQAGIRYPGAIESVRYPLEGK
ncbi:NAD(P)-binding protein [Clathrospora elynae]|uniref:D-xylose 1-dehydrogenase (NADP(+), D-xylono-1,5-lactone-forming) n=1 Tax=Clathrospora elynae TaxID=706981 RepID=A0A6A5SRR9_9PLEO|nr:NAD(P)-binding protein [Clathrospora elynae]